MLQETDLCGDSTKLKKTPSARAEQIYQTPQTRQASEEHQK